jgi:hypothetical protein
MTTPTDKIRREIWASRPTVKEYREDLERAGHPAGLVISSILEAYLELKVIRESDTVIDAWKKIRKFNYEYVGKVRTRAYIA